MQMPVLVGILIVVMALIAFSNWFFGIAKSMGELVLDDQFFSIRIIAASVFTILLFAGSFFAIAIVSECDNEERQGFFEKLNCEEYLSVKTAADSAFQFGKQPVDKTLQ